MALTDNFRAKIIRSPDNLALETGNSETVSQFSTQATIINIYYSPVRMGRYNEFPRGTCTLSLLTPADRVVSKLTNHTPNT
jgi:hypothetical protein